MGNRWQQNVTAGKGPSPQLSFNQSNNQLMQATYDPAGNERIDSSNHSYKYDADGNVIQVDSGSSASYYNYDSLNQRVAMQRPSGSNEFVFDQYGKRVSVWFAPSQTLQGTLVYWNGKPLLVRANGATHFEHADWLGTVRMRTGPTGAVGSGFSSLPFGDGYAATGESEYAWEHFAGTEYDHESDTSHAQFRQYNSTQGRWMSPDPYDGSYDSGNPQSLNRYSYVLNNPLAFKDPTGLFCEYGTDAGDQVEEWDFDSTEGECSSTGGSWSPDGYGSYEPVDFGNGSTGSNGGGTAGSGSGPSAPQAPDPKIPKMTKAQCAAASTILAREAQYGTPQAARMSGNTFGDGTLSPFNSTSAPNLQSPVGQIDLDWFTDVSGYGGGQYTNALVYTVAKTGWTLSRLMSGASIGHYVPYADPGERNAVWQSTIGTQYADIFTPQYMQQACGGHGW